MGVERVNYISNADYTEALRQEEESNLKQYLNNQQAIDRTAVQETMKARVKTEVLRKATSEKALKSEMIKNAINPLVSSCQRCDLYKTKKNYILGKGNPSAEILFVGEAPGKEEDEQGKPFVGNAGIILDLLIEEAGFVERDYYITNILKCRPPNNRNPEECEIRACFKHLLNEIDVIQPKYIVCLGNYAVRTLFNYFKIDKCTQPISKIHGELFIGINPKQVIDDYRYRKVNLIPMYHPAVGLYKPELRTTMLADMNRLCYYYVSNRVRKATIKPEEIPF